MTKEERVLSVIRKKEVDYLPSQITFADRTRKEMLSKSMGMASVGELDDYLENHLYMTVPLDDGPLFYKNDKKMMQELQEMGYCRVDWENNVVYDRWGLGIDIGSEGFFPVFHPLQGGAEKGLVEKSMPSDFKKSILFASDEEAIRNYSAPDYNKEDNFSWMARDIKEHAGKYLVWPSGLLGIFERAWTLMGFEEFLTELVANPGLVEGLLDTITDYKVEVAKRAVEMGFKVGNYGDDLGNQRGPMFSRSMFQKFFKPRMARIFGVFKDAGLPMMMHSCGNITEFVPDLIEIGLDVLEPTQPCMDHKYLKREFGKDLTFWGGIDTQNLLPYGTPEQIKKMAAETIRILGKGGGHIIAPSQEIMKDVPIENVKALVETIIEEREKVINL